MDSRDTLCEIGKKMCCYKLVVACDGNISYRKENGHIIITPSGVSKGSLTRDMLLELDLQGNIITGKGKPSSETNLHLAIYRKRPDVNAVLHAHPIVSTALTVAGAAFPDNIVTEGRDYLGHVVTVPYAEPASMELAESCAAVLADVNVILMANHGAVSVGNDLYQALYRMETLEAVASIYRDALILSHGTSHSEKLKFV
ncbi:class II aldolase/adducin family protein [Megasphaera paucivorans]|uniref:L-fuculose-phosphate aldolase n=1 Tax=Megasphaera paucivorans TaxID=349095 RepID=A0A1G9VI23_9FIRM|nr:class II aldolase/adducin family protein [Megasphaera paucivorans]SDM71834.1 L-fuculose-phosphate aldolase [Megasphaera paucivorans]